jgi:type IV pilus assembly protein PilW
VKERIVKSREGGFTLVEILVALALTGIVAAAVYRGFGSQQKAVILQDQVVGMQHNLRAALHLMAKDIRMAGYDPNLQSAANAGIISATSCSVQFTMDLNENGHDLLTQCSTGSTPPCSPSTNCTSSECDAGEKIQYALMNDDNNNCIADDGLQTNSLGRKSWDGSLLSVSDNIEVVNFVYLDNNAAVIPAPVVGEDRARIRAMQITLIAKTGNPDKDFTDTKTYRNQQNTVIFTPSAGDHYRRRLLTTTVEFRNMGLIK